MIFYFTAFAVFTVVLVLASQSNHSARMKVRHHFDELAGKWGLEVDGNSKTSRYFRASGRYKNYYVILLERGTWINYFPCIKVICHNPLRKNFYLCPERSLSRTGWNISFAKFFRIIRDNDIGDPDFDNFFYISGKGTVFFQQILTDSIRASLLNIFNRAVQGSRSTDYSVNLSFERNEFQYIEGGRSVMDEQMKVRFEEILETIISMAEKVDKLYEF